MTVSPEPSPLSRRSRAYWLASMSWYSSTLTSGQRARNPAASAGSSPSNLTGRSTRPSKSTRSQVARALRNSARRSGSAAAAASSWRAPRCEPAISVATPSRAGSSAMPKSGVRPARAACSRRITRPSPWKVVTVSRPACAGISLSRRSRISRAARRVKVRARQVSGATPRSVTCAAMRQVSVRVLPVPGPAMIIKGPAASAATR